MIYSRQLLEENFVFNGTKDTCLKVEILQNPNGQMNGELHFLKALLSTNLIDWYLDIGASNPPFDNDLFSGEIKAILIDNNGLPDSTHNSISIQGLVDNNEFSIDTIFDIFGLKNVFLKIDTDESQLIALKGISDKNWQKISVIQFEYEFWHKSQDLIKFVLYKLNNKKCFVISSFGLLELPEAHYDDKLYKNVVIFSGQNSQFDYMIDHAEFGINFDNQYYRKLRKIAQHELVVGFTSLRRSELEIKLDTFSRRLSKSRNLGFYSSVHKIGMSLYNALRVLEKYIFAKSRR